MLCPASITGEVLWPFMTDRPILLKLTCDVNRILALYCEAPLLQFYVCLFEEYLKSGISVVDIIDVLLAGVEYISMSR